MPSFSESLYHTLDGLANMFPPGFNPEESINIDKIANQPYQPWERLPPHLKQKFSAEHDKESQSPPRKPDNNNQELSQIAYEIFLDNYKWAHYAKEVMKDRSGKENKRGAPEAPHANDPPLKQSKSMMPPPMPISQHAPSPESLRSQQSTPSGL
ncbi:hypothetical protein P691DRAFT_763729 [Macrolepiota fuliginosa MF-IS2]|uniref:Uncharacterized protein n=1 Tax=Macrolepiota fuliginosa MF-IS2 TaxID=1400762 RepID=A0A9P5X3B7_9AGAR|nr:hypothetical protein P691DRAFT_763729 [Macrolepiota fuliginosa MF-IS2]